MNFKMQDEPEEEKVEEKEPEEEEIKDQDF